MAKKTTTAKRPKTRPTSTDFEQARDLLLDRAHNLVMALAKQYQASKAEELTTVLDALDSLSEVRRMGGTDSL